MKKIKKLKNYLLAFLLPAVICLSILYFKNVFQNIDSIFVSDLRGQHIVFLNYLRNVLLDKSSIFYSFAAGMGSSMLSTIIFYCTSPINLILLIFEDIRYAIVFIYVIKVSLSGLTMFILLKSKNNNDSFITVLFSTCYALSAFVINYFFCIFWFDSLYLAPLVMLGIDKIFKYEKINLLYIFSLALAIMCNIQMGFGLCIYSLIYYIYSYNINYDIKRDFKKFKQLGIVFIISSLCAGAISGGALLGFGIDYASMSSGRGIFEEVTSEVANLGYILKNFFTVGNLETDYYNNCEPFIYCGLIVSFFSALYLFNNDISEKKRLSAFGVILVFILGFCVNFINLFWHLTSPILLNFRYSIYLGLFLTMLAYECYFTKQKLTKKDIVLLSIFLLVGFFMIVGYSTEVYVIWTFVFLILIFALIILTKNKNKKFEVLLCILVIAEIFMNGYLSIYTDGELISLDYVSYDNLLEAAALNDFEDDYRVMYNYSFTDFTNDSLLLNKNSSLRYFSSLISGNVFEFFKRNSANTGENGYLLSAYDSPLLLSLLGNKYFYLTEELNNSIYKKVDTYEIESYDYKTDSVKTDTIYLYDNPYALSLGYVIENDFSYEEGMDLVDYQNNIIKSFTGNDQDVMVRLDYLLKSDSEQCKDTEFSSCRDYQIINNTNNVLVYVYTLIEKFSVSDSKFYLDSSNRPLLISTLDKKISLILTYDGVLEGEEFFVTTYNETNLTNSLSSLQENMLENVEINKNVLTGEIDSSKSGILFLTIPYNDNFKIYVDGKEVSYYSLLDDSFIGLDIEEGKHNIEIKYVDENYKWYIIVTVSSIVITFVLYYFINKSIIKRKNEEDKIMLEQLNQKKLKKEKKKTTKRKKGK